MDNKSGPIEEQLLAWRAADKVACEAEEYLAQLTNNSSDPEVEKLALEARQLREREVEMLRLYADDLLRLALKSADPANDAE